jgi:hypothetical protein
MINTCRAKARNKDKDAETFLAKFLYDLFTYHIQTTEQDSTSLAAAPNTHALTAEFEISRWSIGCSGSTMATLP